jgi:hypothetical protein
LWTFQVEADEEDMVDSPSACEGWTAAKPVRPAAPILAETGWFPLICRHGQVLAYCDMIRSSESSKYPLALLNWLGKTYPHGKIVVGYDIGCTFRATIQKEGLIDESIKQRTTTGKLRIGTFSNAY